MCFVGRRISYSASLFFLFPCCSLLCTVAMTARSRQQKHKMARSADLARSADPNDAPPALPVLATACDGEVCLWECGATDPLVTFEPHQESITGLRWTSNDRVLASSSHDGTVALSEPSGRLFHTLRPNSSGATPAILSITWSPGSRYLAAGGSDAIVRIFDLQKRAQALVLRGHRAAVRSLSWSPSEVYVASSSEAGEIVVHRVQGSVAAVARLEHPPAAHVEVDMVDDAVVDRRKPALGALQWAPFHPSLLACAANDGTVAVWEVRPGSTGETPHRLFAEHTKSCTGVQWSPVNQHLLASCSLDQSLCFYDVTKDCTVRTLQCQRALTCMAFAHNGVHCIVGTSLGEVCSPNSKPTGINARLASRH